MMLPPSTGTTKAVLLILVLGICCFIFKPLVNYLLDPKGLRKYPNQNYLSGYTNFAYIWERSRGFRTKRLNEQHKTHPILRLGPNSLSFSDVRAIKDIYGHSTQCRKDDQYSVSAGSHFNLLDVVDKAEHARKRKLLSNAFATRNLEQWEFKVSDKVQKLITQLDQRCTEPLAIGHRPKADNLRVDWRKWANLFTVDAIADIGLSANLGLLGKGDDLLLVDDFDGSKRQVGFIESLHGGNRATSIIVWETEWFHVLKRLTSVFSKFFKEQWQHGQNYGAIVQHLVNQRLDRYENGDHLDDFLACLLHDKADSPRNLDRGEIEAEVNVMMNAGSDTTAIALTNVLYYLIKNPPVLAKLRQEVSTALSEEDVIAPYSKVKNLPYLKACIDESLRLSPPVSFGLVRKTPPEGTVIVDEFVAGNTTVSVPAYIAHRDPILFSDPERFHPDRWTEDEDKAKEMRNYFIPFSSGARGCIGRNISYLEQHVLIATIVMRYDFALPTEDWQLDWEEAFNLWPGPMPLQIWKR